MVAVFSGCESKAEQSWLDDDWPATNDLLCNDTSRQRISWMLLIIGTVFIALMYGHLSLLLGPLFLHFLWCVLDGIPLRSHGKLVAGREVGCLIGIPIGWPFLSLRVLLHFANRPMNFRFLHSKSQDPRQSWTIVW